MHRRPWAVLEPGDIDDIVVMLRFCNQHRIQAAARGQGHATFGQAQVKGGLVIEMGTLDKISVGAEMVTAEAGARWSSLLHATLPHGLTPPVLTDYLELSVGGTLGRGNRDPGRRVGAHPGRCDPAAGVHRIRLRRPAVAPPYPPRPRPPRPCGGLHLDPASRRNERPSRRDATVMQSCRRVRLIFDLQDVAPGIRDAPAARSPAVSWLRVSGAAGLLEPVEGVLGEGFVSELLGRGGVEAGDG